MIKCKPSGKFYVSILVDEAKAPSPSAPIVLEQTMGIDLVLYKSRWVGKNVLRIGRFEPSSKVRNAYGYKVDKLPLRVRHWACPACGAALDRDINAAKNIKKIALADALGQSVYVKRSLETIPVSAGVSARGVDVHRHGSQEALTTMALAI
ncbi:Putative transposase DNA-binding domain family [Nitrosococcus oceani AFC27]|uniref:Cas12f1-like TNB domain-containing protein n=1 Tax=Nitrosococcus oceani C-27 TaxID=314279 RepID=A0A0E2Z3J6_9GAMM|nr:zinc ribbon domain-containing protein [Nitrosococcus oceani]EDZ65746.1 Putative transposase DNA-binding domain family [Nitrosococcus oceani AFC27]KFI20223.1 hypothetical protein IB75_03700 [Nitrosococcus oceani C-27]GEM20121.1 hypothetical protein NONS58_15280 [Nitrosococcus oceani]